MTAPEAFSAETVARHAREIREAMPRTLDALGRLVAIPSIAWPGLDPAHVGRSADTVAELAREHGFRDVEILRATTDAGDDGYPAVVATIPPSGPDRPRVLLYAHHDVQPTGDESLWETPPFEATRVGDRLYGRGSADDKAGIMVHLVAASHFARESGAGITLFIEGEEEAGSPSFKDFLHRYRDRLKADVIVVADSANWAAGTPALTTSLRGLAALEFELATLDHAVHSGVYGGAVPDAMLAMTKLLATLHDEDGSVAVEGLGGGAPADVDFDLEDFRRDSGLLPGTSLVGDPSVGVSTRVWQRPSLTVIGLDIPDVDVSSNTLQPRMRAKLSIRLAPGTAPQDALRAVKAHLERHVPWGATLAFGAEETGAPWSADPHDPVVDLARAALTTAWSHGGEPTPAVTMGLGGSIPFIEDLRQQFPAASVLVTGVEDPDARAHSANESLFLPDFERAILAERLLLLGLSGREGAEG